ncbi:hypothetical protein DL770_000283 [Monosporascus sp. CRB-9-2]|nr:hypothetical protein DL770_000283 [Monosporascus sp. CRB-9-2]
MAAGRPKRFARSKRKWGASVVGSNEYGKQDDPCKSGSQEEGEEEEDDYDETNGYNPEVISEDEVKRLKHAPAFISGLCLCNGFGSVYLSAKAVAAPNFSRNSWCYGSFGSSDSMLAIPFHEPCLKILAGALAGAPRLELLDTNQLYKVFLDMPRNRMALRLDYGDPGSVQEQYWSSKGDGQQRKFQPPSPGPELSARIRVEPLEKLLYELLYTIFGLLSVGDLVGLATASWPVHSTLGGNAGFWTLYGKRSFPWFREIHELHDGSALLGGKSLVKILSWADKATRLKGGMRGPLISVANRWQIWGVSG